MAVTTFEDFYNLTKNNIVYFQYQKGDLVLNIKGTLNIDFIPGSDDNLKRYDKAMYFSNLYFNDSDNKEFFNKKIQESETKFKPPEWLKIYSINYENWINIEIGKILSLQVVNS